MPAHATTRPQIPDPKQLPPLLATVARDARRLRAAKRAVERAQTDLYDSMRYAMGDGHGLRETARAAGLGRTHAARIRDADPLT